LYELAGGIGGGALALGVGALLLTGAPASVVRRHRERRGF